MAMNDELLQSDVAEYAQMKHILSQFPEEWTIFKLTTEEMFLNELIFGDPFRGLSLSEFIDGDLETE